MASCLDFLSDSRVSLAFAQLVGTIIMANGLINKDESIIDLSRSYWDCSLVKIKELIKSDLNKVLGLFLIVLSNLLELWNDVPFYTNYFLILVVVICKAWLEIHYIDRKAEKLFQMGVSKK